MLLEARGLATQAEWKNETSKTTKESVSTWLAAFPNVKWLLLIFYVKKTLEL